MCYEHKDKTLICTKMYKFAGLSVNSMTVLSAVLYSTSGSTRTSAFSDFIFYILFCICFFLTDSVYCGIKYFLCLIPPESVMCWGFFFLKSLKAADILSDDNN